MVYKLPLRFLSSSDAEEDPWASMGVSGAASMPQPVTPFVPQPAGGMTPMVSSPRGHVPCHCAAYIGACQNYAPQWYLSANSIHRPPSTISCISQTVPTHQQLATMILVQFLVSFATSLAHFLPVSCVLRHIPRSLSRPLFCCERVNVCRVSCRWSWCPMSCWHVAHGDPWQVPWVVHWRPWLDPRVQPALRRALGSTDHSDE